MHTHLAHPTLIHERKTFINVLFFLAADTKAAVFLHALFSRASPAGRGGCVDKPRFTHGKKRSAQCKHCSEPDFGY